jgi:hypothetical protein
MPPPTDVPADAAGTQTYSKHIVYNANNMFIAAVTLLVVQGERMLRLVLKESMRTA